MTGNLVAVAGLERSLFLLIAAQFAIELCLQIVYLFVFKGAAAVGGPVGVVHEEFELVANAGVQTLGLGDHALELLGGRAAVGLAERPLM